MAGGSHTLCSPSSACHGLCTPSDFLTLLGDFPCGDPHARETAVPPSGFHRSSRRRVLLRCPVNVVVSRGWSIFFLINLFIYLFIYLFLAVLGLRFCARAFSSCSERAPLFIAVRGPLTVTASPVAERRLSSCGSRA